jgi:hypothetical protein
MLPNSWTSDFSCFSDAVITNYDLIMNLQNQTGKRANPSNSLLLYPKCTKTHMHLYFQQFFEAHTSEPPFSKGKIGTKEANKGKGRREWIREESS